MKTKAEVFYQVPAEHPKFNDIQNTWYSLLAKEGFNDIEEHNVGGFEFDFNGSVSANNGGRPLKKWSGISDQIHFEDDIIDLVDLILQQAPLEQIQTNFPTDIVYAYDTLTNTAEFTEICIYTCSHGLRKINHEQAKDIWILYCEGETLRSTGKRLNIHPSTVFRVIKAIKEWL